MRRQVGAEEIDRAREALARALGDAALEHLATAAPPITRSRSTLFFFGEPGEPPRYVVKTALLGNTAIDATPALSSAEQFRALTLAHGWFQEEERHAAVRPLGYDDDGRMTQRQDWSANWSSLDQPSPTRFFDGTYEYDARGKQRMVRTGIDYQMEYSALGSLRSPMPRRSRWNACECTLGIAAILIRRAPAPHRAARWPPARRPRARRPPPANGSRRR